MKLKTNFVALTWLLAFSFVGCDVSNSVDSKPTTNSNQAVLANRDLIDQAEETIFGKEKTGVPECDEVLAELEKPTQNTNESLVERGKRIAIRQGIYSRIRSISANATPAQKAEVGKYCAQIATQLKPAAAPNKK